ncbi:hypothetical protein L665_01926 [Ralstonia solanacearum SD54]|nr:hypothetical protein F504_2786 [Ralstonia pseudosolanacearum FQY_4]ARU20698.1 preprotein translocase subunit TatA [Ralstonia solanacearum]ESS49051.1 hypothetical protein L665_01926 [Ralstonia solanacearum SD54]
MRQGSVLRRVDLGGDPGGIVLQPRFLHGCVSWRMSIFFEWSFDFFPHRTRMSVSKQ